MPTFRLVWEFQESNGATFSEVYYKDAASVADALLLTADKITARCALLHNLNKLVRIRASQTDALRVTGQSTINQFGTATVEGGPSPVGAAAVLALNGIAGGSRKLWLRGLPIAWIHRDPDSGLDFPPGDFVKAYRAWILAIFGLSYGIRRLTPSAPGPLQNKKILQVDGTAGNGTSILTLDAAPGYPFPGQIVIGGASKKDLPSLNGVFSLTAAPNGALITIAYQTPQAQLIKSTTAHCRQAVYQPVSVFSTVNSTFDHYGTHTSKNPLSRSRGARRAVRLRLSL